MIRLAFLVLFLTACVQQAPLTPPIHTVVVGTDLRASTASYPKYFNDQGYQIGGPYYDQLCKSCQIGFSPLPGGGLSETSLTCTCQGSYVAYRSTANLFGCIINVDPNFIEVSNPDGGGVLACLNNELPAPTPVAVSNVIVAGDYSETCDSATVTYGRYDDTSPYYPVTMVAMCEGKPHELVVGLNCVISPSGFYRVHYSDGKLTCDS